MRAVNRPALCLILGLSGVLVPSWLLEARADAPRTAHLKAQADQVAVPMRLYHGRPMIDVEIDGRGPFAFLLDSGADRTVIGDSLVRELDLPVTGETELQSPVGQAPFAAKLVRIERLSVGGRSVGEFQCATMDFSTMLTGPDAPRGVLSSSTFPGALVTFDFERQRVVIESGGLPPANGSDIFDYPADQEIPGVPVTFEGVRTSLHLDTGAPSAFTLPSALAERLPLASEPAVVGRFRTVDAEGTILGAALKGSASIGRFTFPEPELRFLEHSPAGNVGNEILSRFAVTIDHANHRVRLKESNQPAKVADRPRRYGIRFRGIEGDELAVQGVEADSPAAQAGLQAGDAITAMNGTLVAGLDRDARIGLLRSSPVIFTVRRGDAVHQIEASLD